MRVFWRVFWYARLLVAVGFTYWTYIWWDDYRDIVKLMMIVTIYTMWTSDLPDGRKEG